MQCDIWTALCKICSSDATMHTAIMLQFAESSLWYIIGLVRTQCEAGTHAMKIINVQQRESRSKSISRRTYTLDSMPRAIPAACLKWIEWHCYRVCTHCHIRVCIRIWFIFTIVRLNGFRIMENINNSRNVHCHCRSIGRKANRLKVSYILMHIQALMREIEWILVTVITFLCILSSILQFGC